MATSHIMEFVLQWSAFIMALAASVICWKLPSEKEWKTKLTLLGCGFFIGNTFWVLLMQLYAVIK